MESLNRSFNKNHYELLLGISTCLSFTIHMCFAFNTVGF